MPTRSKRRASKRRGSKKSSSPSTARTVAGQRRAVWEGRKHSTSGGLTRSDLMVSKSTGKIVSKRASAASKRSFKRNGLRPDKNIATYKGAHYRPSDEYGDSLW